MSTDTKQDTSRNSATASRVPDGIRALALLVVITAHCLAWTRIDGHSMVNIIQHQPHLWWITWMVQIMPLFFVFAGTGLSKLASDKSGKRFVMRGFMLLSPASLIYLVSGLVGLCLIPIKKSIVASTVGLLLVQLTWFLAVYVVIIAITPLLNRFTSLVGIFAWCGLIAGIDALRIHVNQNLGWLNMIMVWSLFALIGMRLKDLQRMPKPVALFGFIVSWSCAWLAIHYGPYSKALVSIPGIPGISNLGPPSFVLACAGIGQIFLVIAGWNVLEKVFAQRYVWNVIGSFGMRSMQMYLHQMVFIMISVAPFLLISSYPQDLSLLWWLEHFAVLAVTLTLSWFSAPYLRQGADKVSRKLLVRLVPSVVAKRVDGISRGWARLLLGSTGVLMLGQSWTGVNNPLQPHSLFGLQIQPIILWLLILLSLAVMATVAPSRGRES